MNYKGNIKVGCKVRCIKNENVGEHGIGWRDGYIFIVDKITTATYGTDKGRYIAWPVGDGHGIFTDCILPVNLLPEEFFKI